MDEYPALIYGANCPQNLHPWTAIEQTFLQDWDDGYQSEDMLKLNVWTPSLTGKRAVLVYFHGAGYSFGSSYELPSQEGAQMARYHDVVSVTVNHRLNILGFLDVSEIGGSAYEDSVNVGMTDLVQSLKWVQENIANFGGDPDRVMIYGQSGGDSKVTTLMGMPSAVRLFHRASVQSGGGGNIPTREQQRAIAQWSTPGYQIL
jgi:para-nitrobenzyl esterase